MTQHLWKKLEILFFQTILFCKVVPKKPLPRDKRKVPYVPYEMYEKTAPSKTKKKRKCVVDSKLTVV